MIINSNELITTDDLRHLAEEIGFTSSGELNMDALVFRPEVREMCNANACRSYGKVWSCPPAAGSLEAIAERVTKYHRGIIVQTTGKLRREIDMHRIFETGRIHKKYFDTLVRQVRMMFPGCLPMGAGACTVCSKCTYPDRPCRHPERMFISMEAYGLVVNDVCRMSGLEYNYGQMTTTYTSCILID